MKKTLLLVMGLAVAYLVFAAWWARQPVLTVTFATLDNRIHARSRPDAMDGAPVVRVPAGKPGTLTAWPHPHAWPWSQTPDRVDLVLDGRGLVVADRPAGGTVEQTVPGLAAGEHRGTVVVYSPSGAVVESKAYRLDVR